MARRRSGWLEFSNVPLEGVLTPREFGRVGALLLGSAALIGIVGLALLSISGRAAGGPGFHPAVIAGMCAGTLASCVVLVRRSDRFVPSLAAIVMGLAILLISAVAYFAGSRPAPFATAFYVWVGTAFVLLPSGIAVLEVALAGVLDAVLLALQRGHPAPFSSWAFTFGVTAMTAWVIKRVVDAVMTTAANEREARAAAQSGNEELERLSARETEFLAQTSHEIRTPLNVIIGFADILGDGLVGPLNDQQSEYVAEVQGSGRHLLDLIGDLLDVTKVEEGREDLDIVEFDLNRVLEPAVGLFGPEAERSGIRLELHRVGMPVILRGDERKVRQVVLNLLSNAVKFTPSGGSVTVTTSLGADIVDISVVDTGPGVAATDLERIFEEYGQAASDGRARSGTGLGLPLARRFAEQHGGTLEVQTRPGRGSAFTVRLPVAGPPRSAASPAARPVVNLDDVEPPPWRPLEHPDLGTHLSTVVPTLGVGAIALGAVTLAANAIDPMPGYRPGPLLAIAAAAAVVAGWLAIARPALRPRSMSRLLTFATVAFTVADYYAGSSQQAYGAMLYVWIGIAAVAFLSRRAVFVHLGLILAAYAVLLAVQPGNPAPLARWVVIGGMATVSVLSVDTLIARMGALADAERRARIRLESVHGDLEAASRHKTHFLTTMSHELRTPLNAIIGFSEVLYDELFGPLNAAQRDYARDMAEAGRELLALVNDILDLAKVDAGRMDLDITDDVDIASALDAVCGRAIRIPVTLTTAGAPHLDVDEHKFRRIVANLIDETATIAGSRGVDVRAASAGATLTVDVTGVGVTRPDAGMVPLRIAVATAFSELHGGMVAPTSRGWQLTLPSASVSKERV